MRDSQAYCENYPAVRAYALRHAPRDIVAETFLVAWRRVVEIVVAGAG